MATETTSAAMVRAFWRGRTAVHHERTFFTVLSPFSRGRVPAPVDLADRNQDGPEAATDRTGVGIHGRTRIVDLKQSHDD
jgi:hypothetical protein